MKKPHENCLNCTLKDCPFVPSRLPSKQVSSKKTIWVVGESPKKEDVENKRLFSDRGGKFLISLLADMKVFSNYNVVFTTACLCRPKEGDRAPKKEEIELCRWHLDVLYEKYKPDMILALGATALKALGVKVKKIMDARGKIFESKYGPVFVTFSPAMVLRSENFMSPFKFDVKKFVSVLEEGNLEEEKDFEVVIPKTTEKALELFREMTEKATKEKKYVAFDFETLPIPWEDESVGKAITKFGTDPFNPYFSICTVAFAYGNKAFAVPVKMKESLEFLIKDQEEKYRKYFGEVVPENIYTRTVSLAKKVLSGDFDSKSIARTYKGLASYIPELLKYISSPGEDMKENLIKFAESFMNDTIFPPQVLKLARKQLDEYDYRIDSEVILKELRKFAENPEIRKIAHNAKFETKVILKEFGIVPKGLYIDTQILAYLLDETMKGFYNLQALASMYLPGFEEYKKKYLSEDLLSYNAMDAIVTLKLAKKLMTELYRKRPADERANVLKANEFLVEEVTPFLAKVEMRGFKLDYGKLDEFSRKIEELKEELLDKIEELVDTKDVNKKSFKVTFYSLYENDPIYTEKGDLCLNSDAVATVFKTTKNEKLKKLSAYLATIKKLEKMESAFLKKYKELVNPWTGRIHPSFHITGTVTGRLSSSDPNFQQIPREPVKICPNCRVIPIDKEDVACPLCGTMEMEDFINVKELVTADDGYMIVAADYSQMEVRVLAEYTKDPGLMKVLEEGLDMHSYTASKIFGIPYETIKEKKDSDEKIAKIRQQAKSATFGIMYGQTAVGFAETQGISVEEAEKIIAAFFREFPRVKDWVEERHYEVKTTHRCFTPVGRVRRFHQLNSKAFRDAQNFPIQSFASDITLAAAIEIQRRLEKIGGSVIGLVHDSIEAEVPEDKVQEAIQIFTEVMTEWVKERFSLTVPMKADIEVGKNWGAVQEVEV